VMVILVFILGLTLSAWFSRMIGKRLIKTSMAPDNATILQKLTFIFLAILTALVTLAMLNVPITALTFISGALAVGIGFGAQNIINNFISGWILMSERPVRIGDFIEIEDSRGMVEKIGNRSTRVRRIDGVHIMVPNSLLLERSVINWTLVDRNIRTSVTVGVAYGSPVREVEKLIYQALEENKDVLKEPAPAVVFSDFGDNALIFEILFWLVVSGEKELRVVRSDLRFRIDELFREHDITIAFPQRDLHIKTVMPLEIHQDRNQKAKQ
ncbi:MAG TPA: mechanosensitive ion channel domain-containing protein, partial [Xanthomonadales bacterium]|nr:mechanosensitive ion channel domain-containing protein [Xanthomonadales bacterium]